jgi:serpin B
MLRKIRGMNVMNRHHSAPYLLLATLLLATAPSCQGEQESPLADQRREMTADLPPSAERLESPLSRRPTDDVPLAQRQKLVRSINDFGASLYHLLAESNDDNLLLSPLNIAQTLAMVYAGARGRTEREMAKALSVNLPQRKYHRAFNALDASLREESPAVRLQRLTSTWLQKDYPVVDSYLDLLAEEYGAPLYQVDFRATPELIRQDINQWVADSTSDRITDLLPPGNIDCDTRLVVTDVLTFQADWATPFDLAQTRPAPFQGADGSSAMVDMMNVRTRLPYAHGPWGEAVQLPYAGGQWSLVAVLPPEESARRERSLGQEWLEEIDGALREQTVALGFPRFTTGLSVDLKPLLQELGMVQAFDIQAADFTGIDESRMLFLDATRTQAFMTVNEEGTEVAAGTAAVFAEKSASLPREVRFNRPFLFAIRHRTTGVVLLLGRISMPHAP